jgi:hypothetical protein
MYYRDFEQTKFNHLNGSKVDNPAIIERNKNLAEAAKSRLTVVSAKKHALKKQRKANG